MARQLEVHGHDRSGLLAMDVLAFVGIARDRDDLRVLEHRNVKLRSLLGLGIEPQARSDFLRDDLHGTS